MDNGTCCMHTLTACGIETEKPSDLFGRFFVVGSRIGVIKPPAMLVVEKTPFSEKPPMLQSAWSGNRGEKV